MDWAQIIQALCAGLAAAVPAITFAYISWRKFRTENRRENAAILAATVKTNKEAHELALAHSKERHAIAERSRLEQIEAAEGVRVLASEAADQVRAVAETRDSQMRTLGEHILANVNGNLDKVVEKLDTAQTKIAELHAKVENQQKLLSNPGTAKRDPGALDVKRAELAAQGKTIADVVTEKVEAIQIAEAAAAAKKKKPK